MTFTRAATRAYLLVLFARILAALSCGGRLARLNA
jgi:hypothetical protein